MLSVLLPIYNWQVTGLVTKLHKQCSKLNIKFEIICIDDDSTLFKQENSEVTKIANTTYVELDENIGRAKIRNLLANNSKFENLLFIDCDSKISEDFIFNYLMFFNSKFVVYGGMTYQTDLPVDKTKLLRWKYGKKHEAKLRKIRDKKPYQSFKSCNFLISKYIFVDIKFNEKLIGYGHEDTLFGLELKKKRIPIRHIDNSIQHLDLDSAYVFVEKTKQAIQNLARHKVHYQNVKLLKFAYKLKQLKADKLYLKGYQKNKARIIKNLLSGKPKLINLARFKIGYLLELQLE